MTKKKMTDVEKSIFEESEKINTIKAKVKARVSKIDDFALVEEQLSTDNWKDKEFQFTNNTVRLGTLFSGIGAIEHAFQRLKIKHEIVFAGDIDEKCKLLFQRIVLPAEKRVVWLVLQYRQGGN